MAKYGTFKYGKAKYGRYSINIPGEVDLSQLTKYRIRTIDSNTKEGRAVINQSVTIQNVDGPVKVRLRTNDGDWVYLQSITLEGSFDRLRIKAVGKEDESSYIESVVGTIRKKG